MSAEIVVQRLRRFLLVLAGALCIGTVVELLLVEHRENLVQMIPFMLSGLGLISVLAVLLRPQRTTLRTLQIVMVLNILGSLFGVYEHVEHNMAFALEIRPNTTISAAFWEALSGANPLLAPGILALAGMIALAATYYHPALADATAGKWEMGNRKRHRT
jgi:hypothetical protein